MSLSIQCNVSFLSSFNLKTPIREAFTDMRIWLEQSTFSSVPPLQTASIFDISVVMTLYYSIHFWAFCVYVNAQSRHVCGLFIWLFLIIKSYYPKPKIQYFVVCLKDTCPCMQKSSKYESWGEYYECAKLLVPCAFVADIVFVDNRCLFF